MIPPLISLIVFEDFEIAIYIPLLESVLSYGIIRSEFRFNLQIWDIFLIKL